MPAMGYSPLRRYRGDKIVDLSILIGTMVLLAALVVWATR
jgi:hypothetical protein